MIEVTKHEQLTINRERYLQLKDDAATLRQIEDLVDHENDSRIVSDKVREIIAEMRVSRGLPIGDVLIEALKANDLNGALGTFTMQYGETK